MSGFSSDEESGESSTDPCYSQYVNLNQFISLNPASKESSSRSSFTIPKSYTNGYSYGGSSISIEESYATSTKFSRLGNPVDWNKEYQVCFENRF
jgi:hypothetical protein